MTFARCVSMVIGMPPSRITPTIPQVTPALPDPARLEATARSEPTPARDGFWLVAWRVGNRSWMNAIAYPTEREAIENQNDIAGFEGVIALPPLAIANLDMSRVTPRESAMVNVLRRLVAAARGDETDRKHLGLVGPIDGGLIEEAEKLLGITPAPDPLAAVPTET